VLALLGCGDDPAPLPDRVQIRALVQQFFADAVDKDAAAICSVLTPKGRAWATQRGVYQIRRGESIVNARHKRPASLAECVEEGAPGATVSSDLPIAWKNGYRPKVVETRKSREGLRVRIKFTAFFSTWVMRDTDNGWRIHYFHMPVRE